MHKEILVFAFSFNLNCLLRISTRKKVTVCKKLDENVT